MNQDQKTKVYEILKSVNLTINSIKDSSTILLQYCSEDYREDFTKLWDQVFLEKRGVEKDRIGLFFILHELLYRSENEKFKEGFYNVILQNVMGIKDTEHNKLKSEILKLTKLWIDHKVFDKQKIFRLTMNLGIEDQSVDEMLKAQLPENLPNPPNELVNFAQNIRDLKKFKEKVKENNQKLQQTYDVVQQQAMGGSTENVSVQSINDDINNNVDQLKRHLELENKYRTQVLKYYKDILNFLDKEHKKNVVELKLFMQKIAKLEQIRDNIELP
ncbi:hypothetical protein ABPG72_015146 [Tetrahymena utriculariae]